MHDHNVTLTYLPNGDHKGKGGGGRAGVDSAVAVGENSFAGIEVAVVVPLSDDVASAFEEPSWRLNCSF